MVLRLDALTNTPILLAKPQRREQSQPTMAMLRPTLAADTVSFGQKASAPRFAGGIKDILYVAGDQRKARRQILEDQKRVRPNFLDDIMRARMTQASRMGDEESPRARRMGDPVARALLKNNIIELDGVVSDYMFGMVRQKVTLLISAMQQVGKRQPIRFMVNSPGGSVLAMNGILDMMDMAKATKIKEEGETEAKAIDVETYCTGYAASAASVIMANGTPGKRYISPRAKIMIHQPLGGSEGQETEMRIAYEGIREVRKDIEDFFNRTTKVTDPTEINKLMERDYWMKPAECVEKGFVDGIVDRFPSLTLDKDTMGSLRPTKGDDADDK